MKALIVLDDKEKLASLSSKLTNAGFDTICYQWLMKALDNLEEISPHLVLISAEDYPRHWKVFVQHIKLHNDETKVFLITSSLTEEEQKKVEILGIEDIIYDIDSELQKVFLAFDSQNHQQTEPVSELEPTLQAEPLSEPEPALQAEPLFEPEPALKAEPLSEPEPALKAEPLFEPEQTLTAEPLSEPEPTLKAEPLFEPEPALQAEPVLEPEPTLKAEPVLERKIVSSCDFFITNPFTNRIICGKVKKYKYPTLIFIPNNQDEKNSLRFGQTFENCILKQVVNNKELSSNHRCQIRGFTDNSIEFCLLR